jgi:hypothetical protein
MQLFLRKLHRKPSFSGGGAIGALLPERIWDGCNRRIGLYKLVGSFRFQHNRQ